MMYLHAFKCASEREGLCLQSLKKHAVAAVKKSEHISILKLAITSDLLCFCSVWPVIIS